ncbi:hypothetical protein BH09BAC1_BH09BAC1_23550 [soil metagenome]
MGIIIKIIMHHYATFTLRFVHKQNHPYHFIYSVAFVTAGYLWLPFFFFLNMCTSVKIGQIENMVCFFSLSLAVYILYLSHGSKIDAYLSKDNLDVRLDQRTFRLINYGIIVTDVIIYMLLLLTFLIP